MADHDQAPAKIDLAETRPSVEAIEPKPKPSAIETQVELGIVDTRPSIERLETKEDGPISPLEHTMPSTDGLGFRVEDELDHARERDAIEAMLFGTPVATHRIGRFAILDRLGQGAMGTVYTAYDEELDRKVAVKVLRYREQDDDSSTASARLLREAQAMARLSHPNIVGVHEVGRHEGRVFVAMEFVRGVSLDRWLREGDEPRPWRDVVQVFRQAGEGLAAAHAAGVIHRDFKPHNVIRGDDGIVRVLDFGLARQVSRAELELPPAGFDGALSVATAGRLTATGAVMGTPAYMAPEQCLGELADARSDQFGFCAALYEGLYRQLPFAGDNFYELFANVTEGKVREPSKAAAARVPAWIHRIVMRGLATAPEQRFASMRELVDALGRDPAVTRRRRLGVAAIVLSTGLASVGLTIALQDPPTTTEAATPCSEVAAGLSGVHDAARMQRAEQAVIDTGSSYARDTWSRLAPRLDGYASEWIEHSASVCVAHHDGRLSPTLFDRATACLAERRASLDAVLDVLEHADAGVVEQAIDVVASMPALAACADERWLASAVPRPADPQLAAAVDAERQQLAAAMVLHRAGRSDAAASQIDALREHAHTLGDPALEAEAALARGTVALDTYDADAAERTLSEAITSALAIGHTQVASEAVSRRMFVRGVYQRRLDEAVVDQDYGAALVERLPERSPLRWLYFNNAGGVMQTLNQADRADALYERALASLDDGTPSFEAIVTRSNRAQLAFLRQDVDAALAGQREAVDQALAYYGAEHPMVATYLYYLASLQRDAGKPDEARATIDRALAILDAQDIGSDARRRPLRLAAELALEREDFAAAKAFAEQGLADADAPNYFVIMLRHALADAHMGLGEVEAGLAAHRHALADAEQFYADNPSEIAWSHELLSAALVTAGQLDGALEQAKLALARREGDAELPAHARFSGLLQRGAVELAMGQLGLADATLTEARATMPEDSPLLADLAELDLQLAKALRDAGKDGRPAAERARATYERLGPDFRAQLERVNHTLEGGDDD